MSHHPLDYRRSRLRAAYEHWRQHTSDADRDRAIALAEALAEIDELRTHWPCTLADLPLFIKDD